MKIRKTQEIRNTTKNAVCRKLFRVGGESMELILQGKARLSNVPRQAKMIDFWRLPVEGGKRSVVFACVFSSTEFSEIGPGEKLPVVDGILERYEVLASNKLEQRVKESIELMNLDAENVSEIWSLIQIFGEKQAEHEAFLLIRDSFVESMSRNGYITPRFESEERAPVRVKMRRQR